MVIFHSYVSLPEGNVIRNIPRYVFPKWLKRPPSMARRNLPLRSLGWAQWFCMRTARSTVGATTWLHRSHKTSQNPNVETSKSLHFSSSSFPAISHLFQLVFWKPCPTRFQNIRSDSCLQNHLPELHLQHGHDGVFDFLTSPNQRLIWLDQII